MLIVTSCETFVSLYKLRWKTNRTANTWQSKEFPLFISSLATGVLSLRFRHFIFGKEGIVLQGWERTNVFNSLRRDSSNMWSSNWTICLLHCRRLAMNATLPPPLRYETMAAKETTEQYIRPPLFVVKEALRDKTVTQRFSRPADDPEIRKFCLSKKFEIYFFFLLQDSVRGYALSLIFYR